MSDLEVMSTESWKNIQDKTGDDILGITIDFQAGRVSAGDTMDKLALHCECAYKEGIAKLEERVRELEEENGRLRFRECPVCGRRITVLHELAAHMTDGEPCPGSCSLVR